MLPKVLSSWITVALKIQNPIIKCTSKSWYRHIHHPQSRYIKGAGDRFHDYTLCVPKLISNSGLQIKLLWFTGKLIPYFTQKASQKSCMFSILDGTAPFYHWFSLMTSNWKRPKKVLFFSHCTPGNVLQSDIYFVLYDQK